jgi:hypothetical protein
MRRCPRPKQDDGEERREREENDRVLPVITGIWRKLFAIGAKTPRGAMSTTRSIA